MLSLCYGLVSGLSIHTIQSIDGLPEKIALAYILIYILFAKGTPHMASAQYTIHERDLRFGSDKQTNHRHCHLSKQT